MAQRVRLHPAVIAIGVVVVGQLFGFVGLFVAVPILSLIIIWVEEFWVKPIEEVDAGSRRPEIELPDGRAALEPARTRRRRSDQLRDRDHRADQHEDHDQDLKDDPEARQLARLLDDRLAKRDRHRVHAGVRLELEDRALGVRLHGLGAQPDAPRDLLGVEALAPAAGGSPARARRAARRTDPRTSAARATATGPRTACRPSPCGSPAAGPPAASPSSRSRARRRRSRPTSRRLSP